MVQHRGASKRLFKSFAACISSMIVIYEAYGADVDIIGREESCDIAATENSPILQAFVARYARGSSNACNLSNYDFVLTHVLGAYCDVPETLPQESNFKTEAINANKIPLVEVVNSNKTAKAKILLVTDKDSQNVALDLWTQGHKDIVVMNAANPQYAGGSWTCNRGTQEESLYFTTDLFYRIGLLTSTKEPAKNYPSYYKRPIEHESFSKDNDNAVHAIYSPNIVCFRKSQSVERTLQHQYELCQPFSFHVVGIAAFNLNKDEVRRLFISKDSTEFSWNKFQDAMTTLYDLSFRIAQWQGHSHIVAIPLGCGAFSYPGKQAETYEHVAKAFMRAIKKYQIAFDAVYMVAIGKNVGAIFENILAKDGLTEEQPVNQ